MIKEIKIFNFKTFQGLFELPFNDGLNIIVGDNEAGKSTIIEAIHLGLSGWFSGRYISNQLNQYLFNYTVLKEYLDSIEAGAPIEPPKIFIEFHFAPEALTLFDGNKNHKGENSSGFTFKIELDPRYQTEYEMLVGTGKIKTLPIEYYHYYWECFARDERITPRTIPLKSALIDSSKSSTPNGSDIYVNRIVKDFLDSKDIVDVSQAHRKMKELFMEEESIKAINQKIQTDSKITDKTVELSVEFSSKNAWEHSLITYLDKIPFSFIGNGEQCIIKTKLALSHKKSEQANILLIEEPENHLSHSKLNILIKDILDNEEDKQIIVSTHSSFVANKLGLDNILLLNDQKILRLSDLEESTHNFFKKLSGYDTLRLILCKKAILVEGDSDELVVQKAYSINNGGKLPIEDGVDVISVGTSFLRFIEIAHELNLEAIVVTDTDGKLEALESKYSEFIGENKKENITISYDSEIDIGELEIGGKPFNYNTLEPKILKSNSLELLNEIFETAHESEDSLLKFMKSNKTFCALKIFETDKEIIYPQYILDAI